MISVCNLNSKLKKRIVFFFSVWVTNDFGKEKLPSDLRKHDIRYSKFLHV